MSTNLLKSGVSRSLYREGICLVAIQKTSMRRSTNLAFCFLLIFFIGCSNPHEGKKTEDTIVAEGYKVLTGQEIKTTFTGNTLIGKNKAGKKYVMYFLDASESVGISGGVTDIGTWKVEGDVFCQTWENWRDGKEIRGRVARRDDHIRFLQDGYAVSDADWFPGNPEGI